MSDYNLDKEIEEGLARAEKMVQRQRLVWGAGLLTLLAAVAGIFYALGAAKPTPEAVVLVVTATPLPATETPTATFTPASTATPAATFPPVFKATPTLGIGSAGSVRRMGW